MNLNNSTLKLCFDNALGDFIGDKPAGELLKIRSDIPVILCTGFSEGITGKVNIRLDAGK